MRIVCVLLLSVVLNLPVYACSMGMSLYFESGIPEGYSLIHSQNHRMQEIVQAILQRSDWVYAKNDFQIMAPDIAENSAIVPVTINMSPQTDQFRFARLIVLAEKYVDVLVTKDKVVEIPNRHGQVPLDLKLDTVRAGSLVSAATYHFSVYSITRLSMRLNLSDVSQARVIALLIPVDRSEPVQVIRQKEVTRLVHGCDETIYVDGPLPKGAIRGFYYF